MPNETQTFQLKYDGPALADHTIEITDLAPALIGLSELIEETNRIINGNRTSISLKIKATEPGCFQVQIQAVQTFADAAIDLLSGKGVTALVQLLVLLGLAKKVGDAVLTGYDSVIEIIRRLRGKPPKSVTTLPDGLVEIELPTGEKFRVQDGVWEICVSHKARTAVHKFVKPLEKEGIEEMEIINERETVTRVTKAEARYFVPPEQVEEELQSSERVTHVSIVNLWFTGENKWKFSEGGNVFSANISDQEFIRKMLSNEEFFQAGDFLKVRLRQTQYMTQTGLKSEWEITEVLDHIRGAKQIPLPL